MWYLIVSIPDLCNLITLMTILSELALIFNSLPRAVVFNQPDVDFEKKSEDEKKKA